MGLVYAIVYRFDLGQGFCAQNLISIDYVQVPKYHIYVEYAEPDKSGIRFNVPQEELVRTFSSPFNAGQPFWFMGKLLNPQKVIKAVIFWSYETADKLTLPNQENLVAAKDKKYLIESILKGKVKGAYLCTEKFLSSTEKTMAPAQSATSVFGCTAQDFRCLRHR